MVIFLDLDFQFKEETNCGVVQKNATNFQEQIYRKDLENIKQNTKIDIFLENSFLKTFKTDTVRSLN